MGTVTGLFSRAKSGNPTIKKPRGFLSLPGEIRNQVYAYYFESSICCEVVASGRQISSRKLRTVKLWAGAFHHTGQVLKHTPETKRDAPITIRMSRRLGKYTVVQGLQTNWHGSLYALNLVCKLLHAETVAFLYRKTVFVFDAPKRVCNFLAVVSQPRLECIARMEMHYSTYGCPKLAKDVVWQEKHHGSWVQACKTAARKMGGLRELKVWMRVNQDPLRFSLRETYVAPVLQFRRLAGKLERVEIDFCTALWVIPSAGTSDLLWQVGSCIACLARRLGKPSWGRRKRRLCQGFERCGRESIRFGSIIWDLRGRVGEKSG
jgi:hypothetical protein